MFYFMFSYNPVRNVMFILLKIFDSAEDKIDSETLC